MTSLLCRSSRTPYNALVGLGAHRRPKFIIGSSSRSHRLTAVCRHGSDLSCSSGCAHHVHAVEIDAMPAGAAFVALEAEVIDELHASHLRGAVAQEVMQWLVGAPTRFA